jgi:hypothetical protein
MENRLTSSQSSENLKIIKSGLSKMAVCRGADPPREAIEFYAHRLAKENLEDVVAALQTIEQLPRGPGDLSFPELGAVLAVVGTEAVSRANRTRLANQRFYVRFYCKTCGNATTGFLTLEDDRPRTCPSPYGPLVPVGQKRHYLQVGEVCGEIMEIETDERPRRHA